MSRPHSRDVSSKDTTFRKNLPYNLDAPILFHFGYICVSPAMEVIVPDKGSDYGIAMLDSGNGR